MLKDRSLTPVNYGELQAAISMYQMAYISFIRNALALVDEREAQLGQVGHNIATLVLKQSLHPLRESVMLAIFQNLVILNHQEKDAAKTVTAINEAIQSSWEDLFLANLLRTDMADTRMICPGNQVLRFAKDARIIEMLYGFVVEFKATERISQLIKATTYAAQDALRYSNYYYNYFLDGKPHSEAVQQLRKRMAAA